jgi:hypothetical protein
MPTFEQTVYVDVDFGDLDEEDLIEEIESRGFFVVSEQHHDIIAVEYHWNRGDKKEALILLERKFPELIGISKLID